jgi:hypothetical protein
MKLNDITKSKKLVRIKKSKDPIMGYDISNRDAGTTEQPSGIPHKPRHRKFMNTSK